MCILYHPEAGERAPWRVITAINSSVTNSSGISVILDTYILDTQVSRSCPKRD